MSVGSLRAGWERRAHCSATRRDHGWVPTVYPIPGVCQRAVAFVAARAAGAPIDRSLRVTVNFHPDRRVGDDWILERIAGDGLYRSQFETGCSSGAVPIDPSCPERRQFEHANFGGAYDHVPPEYRPKYGALDFLHDGYGAAPWYGSAHIQLNEPVLDRTTFCYPDSAAHPTRFGTADACSLIPDARSGLASGIDPLKVYIEAHIHGPLTLADIEAIVLDPSFQHTAVHTQARLLDVPIHWHPGFMITTQAIREHTKYRGQGIADLACLLAQNEQLRPACLTAAAASGIDPRALRRVWHCLARFGRSDRASQSPKVQLVSRSF